jgi:hypothetical protein
VAQFVIADWLLCIQDRWKQLFFYMCGYLLDGMERKK